MSTMFVGAALGLFPVTAGSSQFQIGSPFFDSTTITYANGSRFTVKADGVSRSNYYVQNATLNGKRFDNTWLDYSQIISGGTLDFTMGSKPSRWGAHTKPAYSLNTDSGDTGDGGTGDGDTGDGGTGTEKGDTVVSARPGTVGTAADGTVDGSVKLTLDGPASFAARKGTSLTRTGAATVTGLPGGVTADLRVSGSRTATLSLTGTAKVDARFGITFHDTAFAHGVRASTVGGTGISPTDPLVISAAAVHREALGALVDQASLVRGGNYSDGSWSLFRSALERARTVLADTASATGTIMAADDALHSAIDALTIDEGGYAVLQAEDPDQKEGPSLISERNNSDGNLGGVTEGSWERFTKLDFGGVAPQSVSVRYANSQATNAEPSSVDIHAGCRRRSRRRHRPAPRNRRLAVLQHGAGARHRPGRPAGRGERDVRVPRPVRPAVGVELRLVPVLAVRGLRVPHDHARHADRGEPHHDRRRLAPAQPLERHLRERDERRVGAVAGHRPPRRRRHRHRQL